MLRLLRPLIGIEAISKRWMALLLTASVAHACGLKGVYYLQHYPGWIGWTLFVACPFTAIVVGVNLIELTRRTRPRTE